MGAGSLWGGDSGLDEGVGRPEQSSRCVLKADPTVGWLWVMTKKGVNSGSDPAPPSPPHRPWGALALTPWGLPTQRPTAFPSHHKFPRQKSEYWGPVSNPLHPPWTEDPYSEVCLLGRAVDRAVTSNSHSARDSWCIGRWGVWQALNLKG